LTNFEKIEYGNVNFIKYLG